MSLCISNFCVLLARARAETVLYLTSQMHPRLSFWARNIQKVYHVLQKGKKCTCLLFHHCPWGNKKSEIILQKFSMPKRKNVKRNDWYWGDLPQGDPGCHSKGCTQNEGGPSIQVFLPKGLIHSWHQCRDRCDSQSLLRVTKLNAFSSYIMVIYIINIPNLKVSWHLITSPEK